MKRYGVYRILIGLIVLVGVLGFSNSGVKAYSEDVHLQIDGTLLEASTFPGYVPPRIIDGRTLVPIRVISEYLGWHVEWFSETRQVLITKTEDQAVEEGFLLLTIDDTEAIVDGEPVPLDVPPTIFSDRTLVPVRFVAESFGSKVDWDDERRLVSIQSETDDADAPNAGGSGLHVTPYALRLEVTNPYELEVIRETQDNIVIKLTNAGISDELAGSFEYESGTIRTIQLRWTGANEVYLHVDLRDPLLYVIDSTTEAVLIDFAVLENVSIQEGPSGSQLTLTTNIPIPWRHFTLEDPSRIVIDLLGVGQQAQLGDQTVNNCPVLSACRLGRHREATGDSFDGTRLVLDLKKAHVPLIDEQAGANGFEIGISFGEPSISGRRIVLDPGHGGSDPGARGATGLTEKAFNLAVSLVVAEALEAAGAEVLLTRTRDEYIHIYDRPELANQAKVDAFISIHANAEIRHQASGTETYYYSNHPESRSLADLIHQQVVMALGRPDRGVRFANFAVLREAEMPAVLLETLYLTCVEDEQLLLDPATYDKVADAILIALKQFFAQR